MELHWIESGAVPFCDAIFLRHIQKHENEVAHASTHYKEVEHLMRTEVLMFGIKNGKFQRVDHTTNGVDQSAGQQPDKCGGGKRIPQGSEYT